MVPDVQRRQATALLCEACVAAATAESKLSFARSRGGSEFPAFEYKVLFLAQSKLVRSHLPHLLSGINEACNQEYERYSDNKAVAEIYAAISKLAAYVRCRL